MISDRKLWACAQQVLTAHGAGAVDHIAKRVAEFAQSGDDDGVRTWMRIADRVDQLSDYDKARPKSRH